MGFGRVSEKARKGARWLGVVGGMIACLTPLSTPAMAAGKKAPKDVRDAAVYAGPESRATRTVTNFSDALTCMDGLLLQYGKKDIAVISDGIPDATETIRAGTRDMVISALDTMSLRSGAFRFVDADKADENIVNMQKQIAGRQRDASFYIKGSISQVDREVVTSGKRAGVAISELSLGFSNDNMVSNISLELGMYRVDDRTLIPGVRTQNTIQMVRKGSSTDIEGLLPFASLVYEVRQDKAQGTHQTLRTLVELSLIELVGKFTKVPYWRCLSLPATDPAARRVALQYFQGMTIDQRIAATQRALTTAERYNGPVGGPATAPLNEAIMRYRIENNLAPGTDIDFELYFSFLAKGYNTSGDPGSGGSGRKAPPNLTATKPDTLEFTLEAAPKVVAGEKLRILLTPNKDAYFYCYMGGLRDDAAYRVYPNRFTGKQPMTPAGETLRIPADEDQFAIKMEKVGVEQIACIARTEPYDILPNSVRGRDLDGPIPGAAGLTPIMLIVNEHQKFDPQAFVSSVQVAKVNVVAEESR